MTVNCVRRDSVVCVGRDIFTGKIRCKTILNQIPSIGRVSRIVLSLLSMYRKRCYRRFRNGIPLVTHGRKWKMMEWKKSSRHRCVTPYTYTYPLSMIGGGIGGNWMGKRFNTKMICRVRLGRFRWLIRAAPTTWIHTLYIILYTERILYAVYAYESL